MAGACFCHAAERHGMANLNKGRSPALLKTCLAMGWGGGCR